MARQTQTRERLVQTAGELFWRQGYAHTGVSEIMKRAKATSGSFYHFFPTKGDLLLAVLDAVRRRVEDEILGSAESVSSDPVGRVSALAQAYRVHTVPNAASLGLPIGALVNELGPEHEEARRRIGMTYEAVVDRMTLWFAKSGQRPVGQAEGRGAAELVVAAFEGAALVAMARQNAGPVEVCAELLLSYVAGLGGSGSGSDEMPPPTTSGGGIGDWKAW